MTPWTRGLRVRSQRRARRSAPSRASTSFWQTRCWSRGAGEQVIPPTGQAFEQDWVGVFRFDGDAIASIDAFYDSYTILVQLGLAEGL